MEKNLCTYLLLLLSLASQKVFATENRSWVDQFDNFRFAVDVSLRPRYEFEQGDYSHIESIGIDLHKVFSSNDGGDLGTLILQGYFTKLNSVKKHPSFFDDENDSKFTCRICNFNMTIMDKGKLNLRIGHAEIPFGLEYNQDSNGTLRQYSNSRDLGNKLDWGIAANGKLPWGGYEVSLSRGVGVDWKNDTQSYIVAGRVERSDGYSSYLGISSFYGRLRSPSSRSTIIDRTRIGLDGSTQWKMFTFFGEVSAGTDDDTDRFATLLEVDIQNRNEKLLGYLQLKNTSLKLEHESWDSSNQSSLGIRFSPDNTWTLSGQWTHDFTELNNATKNSMVELQIRSRF
jgi:hypothetical protein